MTDNSWELLLIFVLGMWLYWFLTIRKSDGQYNWPGQPAEQTREPSEASPVRPFSF